MKLATHPLAEPLPSDAAAAKVPVDDQLILRLRVSLARLLANGGDLAVTFYGLLFERYPTVRPLFPEDMKQQQSKLAQTLAWVVTHLDRRDQMIAAVRELGSRHVAYGAKLEHYPLVRDTLIEAMGRTAGADWSEELAADWRLTIDLLARHMVAAATSTVPR
jgi:nitric oxide dioxygenase